MSAAAIFANKFVGHESQPRTTPPLRRFLRKMGAWGFAFFAIKGIAWLLIPLFAMYLV